MFSDFNVFPDYRDAIGGDFNFTTDVGDNLDQPCGFFRSLVRRAPVWRGLPGKGFLNGGQYHARLYHFAVVHQDLGIFWGGVVLPEFFPADQPQPDPFVVVLHFHPAINVGQDGGPLGHTSLEKLFYPGQTAGNIQSGDTPGVEGTHGQLGPGLTDALGGDDAYGLAVFDCYAGGR